MELGLVETRLRLNKQFLSLQEKKQGAGKRASLLERRQCRGRGKPGSPAIAASDRERETLLSEPVFRATCSSDLVVNRIYYRQSHRLAQALRGWFRDHFTGWSRIGEEQGANAYTPLSPAAARVSRAATMGARAGDDPEREGGGTEDLASSNNSTSSSTRSSSSRARSGSSRMERPGGVAANISGNRNGASPVTVAVVGAKRVRVYSRRIVCPKASLGMLSLIRER